MTDLDAIRDRHRPERAWQNVRILDDDGDGYGGVPFVPQAEAEARVAELEAALRGQHLSLSLIVASDPGPPPHAECGVCALLARPEPRP